MESKHIDELLKKYYAGETSVEEENELMVLLNDDELDQQFLPEKEQFGFFEKEQGEELSNDFEDSMTALILEQEDTKTTSLRFYWRPVAATLLVAAGLSFWFLNPDVSVVQEQVSTVENHTELMLSDGSKIFLNANSKVTYPETFGDKREIKFVGEGFFEIEPDPDRPFLIHTENCVIEVLGTSFNVRSYASEPQIEVTVSTGKVSFSTLKGELQERVFLEPTEKAIYQKAENRLIKSVEAGENYIGWKTRKLEFEHERMADVIADLERFYAVEIRTDDQSLLNCRFKASFNESSLEEVMEVLSYSMGLKVAREGNVITLSGAGCPNQ